jgi:hypothetical protein
MTKRVMFALIQYVYKYREGLIQAEPRLNLLAVKKVCCNSSTYKVKDCKGEKKREGKERNT